MKQQELLSKLESLLLIAHKPINYSEIGKILNCSAETGKQLVDQLQFSYQNNGNGWQLIITNNKVQLATSPENSEVVKAYIKEEVSGEMTPAALETLTIIAYRQPVVKAELEQIRGVNCSLILRNLLIRGLVEADFSHERGATVYSVTHDFLKFLGLTSVADLPDYEKLNNSQLLQSLDKSNNSQEVDKTIKINVIKA
jgi:segregation and condensation protein B